MVERWLAFIYLQISECKQRDGLQTDLSTGHAWSDENYHKLGLKNPLSFVLLQSS